MWKLPDGKYIKNPRAGKAFRIGNVCHNETNLLYWDDDTLANLGIYRVNRIGYDSRQYICTGYNEVIEGQVITESPIIIDRSDALDKAREQKLASMRSAVCTYIFEHYDRGTQASFTMLHMRGKGGATIEQALVWIESVLAYYYDKKSEAQAAGTLEELDVITLDFSTFDASNPNISLQELIQGDVY